MAVTVLPHDLLWGCRAEQLPVDAPAWVAAALAAGQPVVVRRAVLADGYVAIGVRGARREQRYGAQMQAADITRRVSPEALTHLDGHHDWPALRALRQLRPMLDASGWAWGVSGSAGFELASGVPALHADSDLDLILRAPLALERGEAQALLVLLDQTECPVDLQVQTPHGAVALREWARAAGKVLLKSSSGALLVRDPWNPLEWAA
jgi:phosphoribosyl-dephospho-CoA transferase